MAAGIVWGTARQQRRWCRAQQGRAARRRNRAELAKEQGGTAGQGSTARKQGQAKGQDSRKVQAIAKRGVSELVVKTTTYFQKHDVRTIENNVISDLSAGIHRRVKNNSKSMQQIFKLSQFKTTTN